LAKSGASCAGTRRGRTCRLAAPRVAGGSAGEVIAGSLSRNGGEGLAVNDEDRSALVGSVLARLVSEAIEGARGGSDGLDGIINVMDALVRAQEALDALYLGGEVPAGLEDEYDRLARIARENTLRVRL